MLTLWSQEARSPSSPQHPIPLTLDPLVLLFFSSADMGVGWSHCLFLLLQCRGAPLRLCTCVLAAKGYH